MLKELLLKAATSEQLKQKAVSSKLARKVVKRFVAGEELDDALLVVGNLNKSGKKATIDFLGEEIFTPEETSRPLNQYLAILDAINQNRLDANVSLKLSQFGLKIDPKLCMENVEKTLERASEYDNFVRIDMEGSCYTQATLDCFYKLFENHKNVGVVMQAYLYRSEDDIKGLIEKSVRVRLCKGTYLEPDSVAFPKKTDVDKNYRKLMEKLLMGGNFPAIATHDQSIISDCKKFSQKMGIPKVKFELQMLLGIRRDLQDQLVKDGYGVRVYTAFGADWYPFFVRRLAERPANLLFFLSNLAKM